MELSISVSEAFNKDERGHDTFSQPPSELKRYRGKSPVKHQVTVLKMKNDLLGFVNQTSLCGSIDSGR
jgi:hypothetical protein